MKRSSTSLLFTFFSSILLGCGALDHTSPPEAAVRSGVIGEWRLVEFVADPGDGSGTYQRAVGKFSETIRFHPSGLFSANTNRHPNQFWFYQVLDDERIEMMFKTDGSNQAATHTWYYRDVTDSTLTLHYGCVERCSGNYVRIR